MFDTELAGDRLCFVPRQEGKLLPDVEYGWAVFGDEMDLEFLSRQVMVISPRGPALDGIGSPHRRDVADEHEWFVRHTCSLTEAGLDPAFDNFRRWAACLCSSHERLVIRETPQGWPQSSFRFAMERPVIDHRRSEGAPRHADAVSCKWIEIQEFNLAGLLAVN